MTKITHDNYIIWRCYKCTRHEATHRSRNGYPLCVGCFARAYKGLALALEEAHVHR